MEDGPTSRHDLLSTRRLGPRGSLRTQTLEEPLLGRPNPVRTSFLRVGTVPGPDLRRRVKGDPKTGSLTGEDTMHNQKDESHTVEKTSLEGHYPTVDASPVPDSQDVPEHIRLCSVHLRYRRVGVSCRPFPVPYGPRVEVGHITSLRTPTGDRWIPTPFDDQRREAIENYFSGVASRQLSHPLRVSFVGRCLLGSSEPLCPTTPVSGHQKVGGGRRT